MHQLSNIVGHGLLSGTVDCLTHVIFALAKLIRLCIQVMEVKVFFLSVLAEAYMIYTVSKDSLKVARHIDSCKPILIDLSLPLVAR